MQKEVQTVRRKRSLQKQNEGAPGQNKTPKRLDVVVFFSVFTFGSRKSYDNKNKYTICGFQLCTSTWWFDAEMSYYS